MNICVKYIFIKPGAIRSSTFSYLFHVLIIHSISSHMHPFQYDILCNGFINRFRKTLLYIIHSVPERIYRRYPLIYAPEQTLLSSCLW